MILTEDFHKLASDLDLTPTQAEAMLDFVVDAMLIVARKQIPEDEITLQAREDLIAS
jgi:hypothetical protein